MQVRLQNSSAVCKLKMGEVEDAESQLQEALERDAKNPETLANIITAGLLSGKPVSRHLKYPTFPPSMSPPCSGAENTALAPSH